jgi:hypothetical protein
MNLVLDFKGKIDALEMFYKKEPVANLSVAQVAFWNGGKETIKSNDIPESDPIEIKLKKPFTLLDARIIAANNPANKISIRSIESESGERFLRLNFEYLDRDEGCIVQIIYNGYLPEHILVSGRVMGAGRLKKISLLSEKNVDLLFPFLVPIKFKTSRQHGRFILIMGLISFLAGLVIRLFFHDDSSGLFLLLGLILILGSLALTRRRIPKGLEIFEEREFRKL